MTTLSRPLWAVFRLPALALMAALAAAGSASAESDGVEVPARRQLGASETMAPSGINGTDASANAPSLAGLSLLATIPAAISPRRGYLVQAQCAAGLTAVLDDQAGDGVTSTMIVLAGPATNGGQGGSLSMAGMPHSGRIRIYSSSASCQMAARSW